MGIEQFIIYDDKSTDGTREFLEAQPDTVILTSESGFFEKVLCQPSDGKYLKKSFHHFLISAIPKFYLGRGYALYADADEFLLLPPQVSNISSLCNRLRSVGEVAIVSSLVDFFPEYFSDLTVKTRPKDSLELFNTYGFFEAAQVADIDRSGDPVALRPNKLRQLIVDFGMSAEKKWWRRKLETYRRTASPSAMSYKTPIVCHDARTRYRNSHKVNRRAPRNRLLTMAHFVFTSNSYEKAHCAGQESKNEGRSDKYKKLLKVINDGVREERSFLGDNSQRFENVQQLLDAGLMRWPGD